MKRLFSILMIVASLSFIGCGDEIVFETGPLISLEVPVSDNALLQMDFPSSLHLTKTDNNIFWEYLEGVRVLVMSSTLPGSAKKTEYPNVYVTCNTVIKILENNCIVVECESYMTSVFTELLGKACLLTDTAMLKEDYKLKELPTYTNETMYLDARHFYMPSNSSENTKSLYNASIVHNGTDWIESWLKDCTKEELLEQLSNIVVCNENERDIYWYCDDNMLYLECGDNICAAKRLSYNQWCIYTSSSYYKNCVLTGITTIRRLESKE